MRRLLSGGLTVLFCASSLSAPAEAQPPEHRLHWSSQWARVHPASYAVSTTAVAATLVFDHLFHPGSEALIRGPILFDAPARGALMARSAEGRQLASTVSDVLLVGLLGWPLVDSLAVAGLGDMNSDVAWQLTWITAESYAADYVLSTFVKVLVHRERPHGARCTLEDRILRPERCGSSGRTRSFFSGHASAGFNSAGLVCITHAFLPLYGSRPLDAVACGTALLTAAAVGILRMVADRHYASDVLIGAISGLLTGMLLPYLLHYSWNPNGTVAMTSAPLVSGAPVVSFAGSF